MDSRQSDLRARDSGSRHSAFGKVRGQREQEAAVAVVGDWNGGGAVGPARSWPVNAQNGCVCV